ncbi:MAG: hypothetical protein KKE61_20360 [Proteobacteria bacterium]|nr:hypothetical protein [Pseudomonadota bacterium]
MFKKSFGVTLIILSTIVYGSIFFLANQYQTSFFDEMLIQLNRITTSSSKKQEISQSKLILRTILENEHPPADWANLIVRSEQTDHEQLFYHYKIWTIKTKLGIEDITDSYPVFESKSDNITVINMRYGKTKPVLQFPFFKDKKGNLITGLFFPINEKPLSADYNNDNKINHEDVMLARKAEQKVK